MKSIYLAAAFATVLAAANQPEPLKLSDQKTPAKFAAQRVTVKGTLDEKTKTIQVDSIKPERGAQ